MTNYLEKPRFDTVIIWSHGLQYKNEIIEQIRDVSGFEIVRIVKYRPKSMKKFVRKVYSYDYAPLAHLKSKIAYLNSLEPVVLCIVIKNGAPQEDMFGEGKFRHSESVTLKNLKTKLRLQFNPYDNGKMSHDHVIHATDNEEQSYHILNAVEDIDIQKLYTNNLFSMPYFLGKVLSLHIEEVEIDRLLCGQATGSSDAFKIEHTNVENSLQYQALANDSGLAAYDEYIKKYSGTALTSDYNIKKYVTLSRDFRYLSSGFETSYVTVEANAEGRLVIVDGLHRAAMHLNNGNNSIKVCITQ